MVATLLMLKNGIRRFHNEPEQDSKTWIEVRQDNGDNGTNKNDCPRSCFDTSSYSFGEIATIKIMQLICIFLLTYVLKSLKYTYIQISDIKSEIGR